MDIVLASDPVYDAIQVVSENGYAVIDLNLFAVLIVTGIFGAFVIGLILGGRIRNHIKV